MKKSGKSFIQINIFGKTIEQMEKGGVDLENILVGFNFEIVEVRYSQTFQNNVGCDRVWIGDMPIWSDDSDSAYGNSSDESTFQLSSSLSNQHIPRCSTPQKPINTLNFSLCASKILSRIKSYSSTVELIDPSDNDEFFRNDSEVDQDDIIEEKTANQITSSEIVQNNNKGLETNLTVGIPFSSSFEPPVKKIKSIESRSIEEENRRIIENLVGSLIDIVCESGSDDSTFYDCDMSLTSTTSSTSNLCQLPTLHGPHPHNRHSEYIESIEMKPSVPITRSLKNIKIGNISIKREERKPLKRTTSEKRITRRKAMKLIRNNSIHPILASSYSPPQIIEPIKIPRELSTEIFNSSQVMLPIVQSVNINRSDSSYEHADSSYRWNHVLTELTPMTVGKEQFYGNGATQSNMEVIEHSSQEINNDDELYDNYDPNDWHSYDDQIGSELDEENAPENHQVVKKRKYSQRRPKYNEKDAEARNSIHRIKCEYQGCDVEYNWRPKYGKLRLIDHCRKHCQTEWLCCNLCDFKTTTLRGIQKHGIAKHPDQKTTESAVKKVLKTIIDQDQLKNTWDMCYKSNLKLVGKPNKMNKGSCEY